MTGLHPGTHWHPTPSPYAVHLPPEESWALGANGCHGSQAQEEPGCPRSRQTANPGQPTGDGGLVIMEPSVKSLVRSQLAGRCSSVVALNDGDRK